MTKQNSEIYKRAIVKWGTRAQEGMFIEEIGEVLTAFNKRFRYTNGCTHDEFLEELVDLDIMLEQMRIIHDVLGQWDIIKNMKLARLEERLNR